MQILKNFGIVYNNHPAVMNEIHQNVKRQHTVKATKLFSVSIELCTQI